MSAPQIPIPRTILNPKLFSCSFSSNQLCSEEYLFWRIVINAIIRNFTRSLHRELDPSWNRVFYARWCVHTYLHYIVTQINIGCVVSHPMNKLKSSKWKWCRVNVTSQLKKQKRHWMIRTPTGWVTASNWTKTSMIMGQEGTKPNSPL